jgi:hypothetical protein
MERGTIPRSLWLTPDFVVDASLAGYDRGQLFVIPGWRYKCIAALLRMLPSWVIRKGSVGGVRRFRKQRGHQ